MDAPRNIPTRVADLREGDMVDLEGDRYADPERDHPQFADLYQEVGFVERETPTCTVVGFEGFDWVGFPPDHVVTVVTFRLDD